MAHQGSGASVLHPFPHRHDLVSIIRNFPLGSIDKQLRVLDNLVTCFDSPNCHFYDEGSEPVEGW